MKDNIQRAFSEFPWVIAHRGASACAPENTFAAMGKAADLGIKWVEFDVMLSQDNQGIILHDARLNRTTNGRGSVVKQTLSTLQSLDAGSWFASAFAGERVPTLTGMLEYLSRLQLHMVIDMKPGAGFEQQMAAVTWQSIQSCWPEGLPCGIVASFSIPGLRALRVLAPAVKRGLGLHRWQADWRDLADEVDCFSLHCNQRMLNEKRVALLKADGHLLLAYTVDEPERAKQLFNWGVDGVFSNCPDKISSSPR